MNFTKWWLFILDAYDRIKLRAPKPSFLREDNYYWDDPVKEGKDWSAEVLGALLMVIIVLLSFEIKAVWAANINLSSGVNREFGQGIQQAVACSGNTSLTLTPTASFYNAAGSGSFKVSGITVSNIPSGCYGKNLLITAYDGSNNQPIALYNSTSSNILVLDNSGTFYLDPNVTGATIVTNSTSSFTVTFTVPVALTSNTYKLAIQSQENSISMSCVILGNCTLGGTGPGGGIIYYYASGGFSCGDSFTSSGSPTGGLCHYLEIASGTWYSSASTYGGYYDNSLVYLCANSTNAQLNPNTFTPTLSNSIGAGRKNTVLGAAYCNNGALKIAKDYSGGGLSDWYLPNAAEINQAQSYLASVNRESSALIKSTGTWYWTSETMAYNAYGEILASQAGYNPSWVSGASAFNHQQGHMVAVRAF